MDKYIGKKLEGRYEILELTGFGGMAMVFKAYDIVDEKNVAIKILKDEYLANDDFKRRFRNESKAIALLSHPSIVKVLDVNFDDNIQYIVMEYIDGITLKEYIEQQGAVKWKEAVHFTVQILRALQHAHDNGIVHRDVKPQNVMLLEDGTIKVMDFGIARFARENGKTLSDKAIGSVHYISPEQAKGDVTDEKTDIYSVGVIMYEMLTGKVPFDGDTPVSIAIKQMQIDPERPRAMNPEIPVGLEEVILRAMQKDPQLRYQTAAEMLRDIDEFKHNPSVVFEYKYFNSDGTTRYFDKLEARASAGGREVDEPVKKSYTMNILAGVAAACVLVMVIALFFFLKGLNVKKQDVNVVSILGMTVEQAQERMPKLKIVITDTVVSPDYDKGLIIEQKPEEGTKVKIDSEVGVVVSAGLQELVVPDLLNETLSSAKAKLELMGLEVDPVQMISENITTGHVIKTDPDADTKVKKGDKITVYVSKGSAQLPISVPDLLTMTEVDARSKLAAMGLRVGKVTSVGSDQPIGTIVTQTPEKGSKLAKGDSVDIEVSNGVPPEVNSGVNININFPIGQSYEQTFELHLNGQLIESRVIDPSVTRQLTFNLELKDNLINGVVEDASFNDVVIMVDGISFASYLVDFKSEQPLIIQSAPDFTVVFPNGYEPIADIPESDNGRTQQGGTSSDD